MSKTTMFFLIGGTVVALLLVSVAKARAAAPAPRDPVTAGLDLGTAIIGLFGARNNQTRSTTADPKPITVSDLVAM